MAIMTDKQELADSILDNFNTVQAVFLNDTTANCYTFKVPKHWELTASSNSSHEYNVDDEVPGSLLVVYAAKKFSIVKVTTVHDQPTNPSRVRLAWAIQVVDFTEFTQFNMYDEKAIQTLTELDTRRVKRELLQEFARDLNPEELAKVKKDLNLSEESIKFMSKDK